MRFVVIALFASLAACASTPGLDDRSDAVQVATELPEPGTADQTANFVEYRMGPTDHISVTVMNAPELTREGQVDGSGNFLLPLVGTVMAGGKTPEELASHIADKLRGRYLNDPQVSVNVLKAQAYTVTVDGAVTNPGIYPIAGAMTLQRVIATAAGLSNVAKADRVVVFRTIDGNKMAAMFDLEDIRAGRVEDPRIYGNDIVVVGESGVRRFIRDTGGGTGILSRFIPIF